MQRIGGYDTPGGLVIRCPVRAQCHVSHARGEAEVGSDGSAALTMTQAPMRRTGCEACC